MYHWIILSETKRHFQNQKEANFSITEDHNIESSRRNNEKDKDNALSGVTKQKERALQFWNESKINHPEALKDQVNEDVMKHLHQGEVLPIFHTLCCPPNKRLFPPNARVSVENPNSDEIRLSTAPVQMGKF